jgi:16S rRNA (guanine527-N7)-methyltransferase
MTYDGDLAMMQTGAAALGLLLTIGQLETFGRYRELLLEWNERINLTAITDPAAIVTYHFLDSLACLLAVPPDQRGAAMLIDVGSGGGFPGIPLAIALPGWQVTLLEATGKKVRFLEAAVRVLELGNARVLQGRAEEVAHLVAYRGRYDIATARAVAALPTLLEYCAPFVRPGGLLVLPKKGDVAEELAAGRRAAAHLETSLFDPVPVPFFSDRRVIVHGRQKRPCPPRYPRAAGAPIKHPLQ